MLINFGPILFGGDAAMSILCLVCLCQLTRKVIPVIFSLLRDHWRSGVQNINLYFGIEFTIALIALDIYLVNHSEFAGLISLRIVIYKFLLCNTVNHLYSTALPFV